MYCHLQQRYLSLLTQNEGLPPTNTHTHPHMPSGVKRLQPFLCLSIFTLFGPLRSAVMGVNERSLSTKQAVITNVLESGETHTMIYTWWLWWQTCLPLEQCTHTPSHTSHVEKYLQYVLEQYEKCQCLHRVTDWVNMLYDMLQSVKIQL